MRIKPDKRLQALCTALERGVKLAPSYITAKSQVGGPWLDCHPNFCPQFFSFPYYEVEAKWKWGVTATASDPCSDLGGVWRRTLGVGLIRVEPKKCFLEMKWKGGMSNMRGA